MAQFGVTAGRGMRACFSPGFLMIVLLRGLAFNLATMHASLWWNFCMCNFFGCSTCVSFFSALKQKHGNIAKHMKMYEKHAVQNKALEEEVSVQ